MFKYTFVLFLIVLTIKPVSAESTVLINEILIDPLPQAVELVNASQEAIDLSNWYVDDIGGTTFYTIPLNTILYPDACVIVYGDFNLNKASSDTVRLFTNFAPPTSSEAQLVNSFTYSKSPGTTLTLQRSPDSSDNWITGSNTLGQFNSTGQNCLIITTSPTQTTTPTPTEILTPSPTPTEMNEISYLDNIFISEIMIYPDTAQEWIEFYNDNDFAVQLDNWYIDDMASSGANLKQFSLEVPAKGYSVLDLVMSIFNNDGDDARLLNSNEELIDELHYEHAVKGLTYGRSSWDNDELCLQNPSKNNSNSACLNITPTKTATPLPTKTPTLTKTPAPIQYITPEASDTIQQLASQVKINSEKQTTDYLSKRTVNDTEITASPAVLGQQTYSKKFNKQKIVQTSIITSFSYSLLAILSIWLKVKQALLA